MSAIAKLQQLDNLVRHPGETVQDVKSRVPSASDEEILKHLAILFSGMKSRNGDDATLTIARNVFVAVLRGEPAFAVAAAVEAFCRGTVPGADKTFVPSTAELAAEVHRQFLSAIRIADQDRPPGSGAPERTPRLSPQIVLTDDDRAEIEHQRQRRAARETRTPEEIARVEALVRHTKAGIEAMRAARSLEKLEDRERRRLESLKRHDEGFARGFRFGPVSKWGGEPEDRGGG
jgi:hypothetical protein